MNVLRDSIYQLVMFLASPHISKERIEEHVDALEVEFSEFEINTIPRINAELVQKGLFS